MTLLSRLEFPVGPELLSTRILVESPSFTEIWPLGSGLPQQELSSRRWEGSGGNTGTLLRGDVPDGMHAEVPEHSGLPGHCG